MDWILLYPGLSFLVAAALTHIIKESIRIWRGQGFSWYTLFLETGGMPSGHSAAVTALAAGLVVSQGMTPVTWVGLLLAFIVIRDSFGVRKSVSDQAQLLNVLTKEMKMERKVRVVLGHTGLQVFFGVLLGLIVSLGLWIVLRYTFAM